MSEEVVFIMGLIGGKKSIAGDPLSNRQRLSSVFVFGSNLAGRHGRGAALAARNEHGAVYGVGEGRTGQSYAIPTKDENLRPRSLSEIQVSVERFIEYAKQNPDCEFVVTRIGCGLAGFDSSEIAPMFFGAPENCKMPTW